MQENTPAINKQKGGNLQAVPVAAVEAEADMRVTVERELVSQAEEEDMEALLGTYVTFFPLFLKVTYSQDLVRDLNGIYTSYSSFLEPLLSSLSMTWNIGVK